MGRAVHCSRGWFHFDGFIMQLNVGSLLLAVWLLAVGVFSYKLAVQNADLIFLPGSQLVVAN